MRKLVIYFECWAPCLWLIEQKEDGHFSLSSTELWDDLWDDDVLVDACRPLEKEFDKTVIDEDGGATFPGWGTEEHMKAFNAKIIELWKFVKEYLKDRYEVGIYGFFDDVNSDIAGSVIPIL